MLGYIHAIETFATFEGLGIRTAVFMQGCPLRCAFCHNPDTWDINGGRQIDSLSLAQKILRNRPYFQGGGGATFTGGEPLLQAEFVTETANILNENGVNAAVATSCALLNDGARALYQAAEFVIADLKFPTPEEYKAVCGADVFNTVIETLDYLNGVGKPVFLTTVIIPNVNDKDEDMPRYAALAKRYANIQKYRLLPFHTMGFSKYAAAGIPNPYREKEAFPREKIDRLTSILYNHL
jgi:pyruvate formate lyase activating enzyme